MGRELVIPFIFFPHSRPSALRHDDTAGACWQKPLFFFWDTFLALLVGINFLRWTCYGDCVLKKKELYCSELIRFGLSWFCCTFEVKSAFVKLISFHLWTIQYLLFLPCIQSARAPEDFVLSDRCVFLVTHAAFKDMPGAKRGWWRLSAGFSKVSTL